MKDAEFQVCLRELSSLFGDKPYPRAMATSLWRIVQPLSPSEFRQVINLLTEDHFKLPTPAQIKKVAQPLIAKARERAAQEAIAKLGANNCRYCGGSGWIIALLRENPLDEFSFRCHRCEAPTVRNLTEKVPYWNDDLLGRFAPTSLTRESFRAARKVQAKRRGEGLSEELRARQAEVDKRGFERREDSDFAAVVAAVIRFANHEGPPPDIGEDPLD